LLRRHLSRLESYWRALFALAAGLLTLFAFAPYSFYPFAVLGPALLFLLWLDATPRQALAEGWSFGIGLLGFGVFWMHISIDQFGNVGTVLAMLITLLFIIAVSGFYGLAGWLGRRLMANARPAVLLILVFPLTWVLGEWLRGWFLTGFPWLALGYSQIDSLLSGFAPVFGVYGVSLAVAVSSGLLVLAYSDRRIEPLMALVLAIVIWGDGYLLGRVQWTEDTGETLKVSLIQGNIDQAEKWKRENLESTLALYRDLSRESRESDVIIWPETAVPAFLHQLDETFLTPLEEEFQAQESQGKKSALLMGIPVWQPEGKHYYNALLALDGERDEYYKRHLVPFGEFMPLKSLIGPLLEWIEIPMSDFSAGAAVRPLIRLAGRPVGVSICYEDAFGEEMIQALPDAQYLVNVSNDAWFGDSLALPQHLEIARMRALETGRYLLRSTNTGISALIDQRGQLMGRSPKFQQHVLSGDIQAMQGMTPYARYGNWLVVAFSVAGLLLTLIICRYRNCRHT